MKLLKIMGWGLAIWLLSLLWPEVNRVLTEAGTLRLSLGLGTIILIYLVGQHLDWHHHPHSSGQNHPSHPRLTMMLR